MRILLLTLILFAYLEIPDAYANSPQATDCAQELTGDSETAIQFHNYVMKLVSKMTDTGPRQHESSQVFQVALLILKTEYAKNHYYNDPGERPYRFERMMSLVTDIYHAKIRYTPGGFHEHSQEHYFNALKRSNWTSDLYSFEDQSKPYQSFTRQYQDYTVFLDDLGINATEALELGIRDMYLKGEKVDLDAIREQRAKKSELAYVQDQVTEFLKTRKSFDSAEKVFDFVAYVINKINSERFLNDSDLEFHLSNSIYIILRNSPPYDQMLMNNVASNSSFDIGQEVIELTKEILAKDITLTRYINETIIISLIQNSTNYTSLKLYIQQP